MGIKKFTTFLRREGLIDRCPASMYQGKRIAYDAFNWIHIYFKGLFNKAHEYFDYETLDLNQEAFTEAWKQCIIQQLRQILSYNIIPIFIFDGKAPSEKDGTKKEREIVRNRAQEKCDRLREELKIKFSSLPVIHRISAAEPLAKEYLRALRDCVEIRPYMFYAKKLFAALRIPHINAKGESEQLCSMLACERRVSAVYSTDMDTLAYHCPTVFIGTEYIGKNLYFLQISLKKVLNKLRLSFDTFLDMCIMSGCDYNNRISGVSVITAYKYMYQWRSIDRLPKSINVNVLKHERCREMFKYRPSEELVEGDMNLFFFALDSKFYNTTSQRHIKELHLEGFVDEFNTTIARIEEYREALKKGYITIRPVL